MNRQPLATQLPIHTTSPPLENPAATPAGDDYLDYAGMLDENEGGGHWSNLRYKKFFLSHVPQDPQMRAAEMPVELHHALHNRKSKPLEETY